MKYNLYALNYANSKSMLHGFTSIRTKTEDFYHPKNGHLPQWCSLFPNSSHGSFLFLSLSITFHFIEVFNKFSYIACVLLCKHDLKSHLYLWCCMQQFARSLQKSTIQLYRLYFVYIYNWFSLRYLQVCCTTNGTICIQTFISHGFIPLD